MNRNSIDIAPPPGVGLIQKTLQILDLFQANAPAWTQSEISKKTGMPRSTVNRLVKFLTERGHLTVLYGQNRYSLGPASVDLGRRAAALFDFRGLCRPVLARLSQETQETIILTSVVGAGNAVRCVDQIESTRDGLRVFEQIGNVLPLNAGAAPRAVLAALPESDRERFLSGQLRAVTDSTPTSTAGLRRKIAETRRRGFAVSNGETYEGVVGIGAAFYWGDGSPAGSLAIALPAQRASADVVTRMGELLKGACDEVSAMMAAGKVGAPTTPES
ncbi:MAG: IclR family transcriptional regulator [Boseongicola sp.]|nr:IclR family transcriptional regulator [Boseongicola sp.]